MRSHFSRPAFLEGIRDMAPMMLGVIPFGMVCGVGAIAAGAGYPETTDLLLDAKQTYLAAPKAKSG